MICVNKLKTCLHTNVRTDAEQIFIRTQAKPTFRFVLADKRTHYHYHHVFSFLATFFLLWNSHIFCGKLEVEAGNGTISTYEVRNLIGVLFHSRSSKETSDRKLGFEAY